MRRYLLAAILCWAGAATANAGPILSLEWQTVEAALIDRGRVAAVGELPVKSALRSHEVTIRAIEVLKGKPQAQIKLILDLRKGASPRHPWVDSKSELLFLLRRDREHDPESGLLRSVWRLLAFQPRVIDLEAPGRICLADLTLAKTRDQILNVVRKQAVSPKPNPSRGKNLYRKKREPKYVIVPADADIHPKRATRQPCALVVPKPPQPVVPSGWKPEEPRIVAAPEGWQASTPRNGSAIHVPLPLRDHKDACVDLFIMPLDWEGKNARNAAEKLVKGQSSLGHGSEKLEARRAAWYLGSDGQYQVFMLARNLPRKQTPYTRMCFFYTRLAMHLGLAVKFAALADSGIERVGIVAPGYASRYFAANGWVNAHHGSGSWETPSVHQETAMVSPDLLQRIWGAAAAPGKETLKRQDKDDPGAKHSLIVYIHFTDGRQCRLFLPKGQRRDAKIQRLLDTLSEVRYGAW